MREVYLVIICLTMSVIGCDYASARKNTAGGVAFEFAVGGGYGNIGIKPNNDYDLQLKHSGSWAATAHIGVDVFFIEYIGLGIGCDFSRYGSKTEMNGSKTWNATDSEGEQYMHTLTLKDWKERTEAYLLELPFAVKFSIPLNDDISIIGELGVKWGLPTISTYKGDGTITHTGYYSSREATFENQPDHGFYTETGFKPSAKIKGWENAWITFGKVGVAIQLIENFYLTAQIYGQYALGSMTNSARLHDEADLGFRNDRPTAASLHYFMQDYTSIVQTKYVDKNLHPLALGAEVGIRYKIPFKHHRGSRNCMCMPQ